MYRIGIGYDFHRLTEDRRLMLGGVEIPHSKGLLGYSDGDALLHAISDALLGAAGLGDIGTHFPSSDPAFSDISSLILLSHVHRLLNEAGYRVINIDSVILAEEPKLAPFFNRMRDEIARVLNLQPSQVSIKATTNEGMDAVGRGEGIAAHAVALLEKLIR